MVLLFKRGKMELYGVIKMDWGGEERFYCQESEGEDTVIES